MNLIYESVRIIDETPRLRVKKNSIKICIPFLLPEDRDAAARAIMTEITVLTEARARLFLTGIMPTSEIVFLYQCSESTVSDALEALNLNDSKITIPIGSIMTIKRTARNNIRKNIEQDESFFGVSVSVLPAETA